MRTTIIVLTTCFALGLCTSPAPAELAIGDKAPPLKYSDWIRGKPVDLSDEGNKKIILLEVWATWCQQCWTSFPHLSELQRQYAKDLTVIGATSYDPGNTLSTVKRFADVRSKEMAYTLAFDKDGATNRAYMAGVGAMGIPQAFLIDRDRRLAWSGDPRDDAMDIVVAQLVAGTYDIDAARVEAEVQGMMGGVFMQLQMGNWTAAKRGLLDILEKHPENELALNFMRQLFTDQFSDAKGLHSWARAHMDAHRDKPLALTRLAAAVLAVPDLALAAPDVVFEAARAAYESDKGRADPEVVAGYARSLYMIGALDRAILVQEQALVLASDAMRSSYEAALVYYNTCKRLRKEAP